MSWLLPAISGLLVSEHGVLMSLACLTCMVACQKKNAASARCMSKRPLGMPHFTHETVVTIQTSERSSPVKLQMACKNCWRCGLL
jgi:hypothetical protein